MYFQIRDLNVYYRAIHALQGISLTVNRGEIVALIGGNGAGKSTTLNSISGVVEITSGSITYQDENVTSIPTDQIVRKGLVQVPEGRHIFPRMTVQENLEMGAFLKNDPAQIHRDLDRVYELFPRMKERRNQAGGTLSGGEQQMLAIGRALMSEPRLLLLDEPSLGLAPNIVNQIFELILEIQRQGVTILLIEQNANMALQISDRAYVLENGRVGMEGRAKDISSDHRIRQIYLGLV